MNNEGLIGWMSRGEVAIIANSIQWRVKSAFITYRSRAVPADALADPFTSRPPDCHRFKLVHIFDKQPNSQTGRGDRQCPSQL